MLSVPANILTGMILGDASIIRGKTNKNAYLKLQHSMDQKQYLIHKGKILETLTSTNIREVSDNGYGYSTVILETKTHPYYTTLRKRWYPSGKKIVSEFDLRYLDAMGLAYWYMDDGSLVLHKRTRKTDDEIVVRGREVRLHTEGFSFEDNWLLRDYLEKTFNIKMYVVKTKSYWMLRCGATEGNKFLEIVRPHVLDMFEYKVDMQYVKSR